MKPAEVEIGRSRVPDRIRPSGVEWRHRAWKPLSSTVGWLGLVAVLTAACSLENAVASIGLGPSTAAEPLLSVSTAHTAVGREETVPIMITLHDRESGRDTQFRCISSGDRAPVEELVVDANALADVAAVLCGPTP
jgi:hypothetical protein